MNGNIQDNDDPSDSDNFSDKCSEPSAHNRYMRPKQYNRIIDWLNSVSEEKENQLSVSQKSQTLECEECQPSEEDMDSFSADYDSDVEIIDTVMDIKAKIRAVLRRNVLGMSLSEFKREYRRQNPRESLEMITSLEFFYRNSDIFSIETPEDPGSDQRLSKSDVIFFPHLIHDSTITKIPVKSVANTRRSSHRSPKRTIPHHLVIYFFGQIKSSGSYELRVLYAELAHYMRFDSEEEVFESLSEVIPIKRSGLSVKLKSLPDIQEFVSQLADKQDFRFIRQLFNVSNDLVTPGQRVEGLDINQIFTQFKGKIIATQMSYVLKPNRFFGHIIDSESQYSQSFDDLCLKLNNFYNKHINGLSVPKELIIKSLNCVTKFSKYGWIRVEVTKTPDFRETDVFIVRSIDFEYHLKVKAEDLKYLRSEFAELPSLSVPFRLNGVKRESTTTKRKIFVQQFRDLVFQCRDRVETNGETFCQIISFDGNSIEVIIFETEDLEEYYSLNDQLVDLGLAKTTASRVEPDWEQLFVSVQKRYRLKE